MPLHIIRQDITKVECDAIVNAANNSLLGGRGVDGAIHKAAGDELLQECKTLGGCETGEVKITKGYNLPCKYVIHTVGPIWHGGLYGERALLTSCYKKALELAKEYGLESIAFPLISSGAYGYPKEKALSIATKTISEFLFDNEMTVYLVVYDRSTFVISEIMYGAVKQYVEDNYYNEDERIERVRREYQKSLKIDCHTSEELISQSPSIGENTPKKERFSHISKKENFPSYDRRFSSAPSTICASITLERSLKDEIVSLDESFSIKLLKLIDKKKMTDVECYKKANVSKQTWYKIMNEKDYRPSKNTVICFAIALRLTLEETDALLRTVGFTLSKSIKFDVIIEFFITSKIYDIFQINETLFEFDQPCLGV